MKKANVKIQNNIFIMALLVVAAVAAAVFLLVIPSIKKAYEAKDELDKKKLQLGRMQEDAVKAKEYSDLVASLKTEEEKLEKAIIKREGVVDFFKEIELISERAENSVSITHVKNLGPIEGLNDPNLTNAERAQREAVLKNTIKLMVVVGGNYRQFLDFFYKVNNMPYIFDIESVEIQSAEQANVLVDSKQVNPDYTKAEIVISFIVE